MAGKRINSNREQVEKARQLLLAAIFTDTGTSRLAARQAVKQLLGPILAARDAGLSFEEIAEKFAQAGLELAPTTLRQYFFDLKAEEERARQTLKNAERIAHVKAVLEQKANQAYEEQSFGVALEHAKRVNAQVSAPDFLSEGSRTVKTGIPLPPKIETQEEGDKSRDTAKPEPKAQAAKEQPVQPVQQRFEVPGVPAPVEVELPSPDGDGMTLDELQQALSGAGDPTELTEDLVLINGRVYWAASKRPFRGKLSRAHLSVLRAKGRLIAPTKGRSSGDFVNMRSTL